ncbi:MAG TPA: LLM class flavin-dependent oxidoreductase [Thermomicrobiales bacterium]|nr:LLM class flavin-dependent oxidoreductase [Thermomicrobiales bacterium]
MDIGLILPLAEDESGTAPSWAELRAAAVQAEGLGFDSVWVYDHLLHRFEGHPTVGFWEAWTMLTAIAASTTRVQLGTTVLCAGFRNPALLAKMAETLDEVSGGRLILGLGAGWHEPEFDAFGMPFDHRVSRFEEALQVIRPLLHERKVDFRGTYHRAELCEVRPHGPREGGVPILVAAFAPRMLRLTARYADQWTTDWLGPVSKVKEEIGKVRAACEAEGRDPATLTITGGVTVAYPDLGNLPAWMSTSDSYLTGDAEGLAAQLISYRDLGVDHILTNLYPFSPDSITQYGEAVSIAQKLTR